MPKTQRSRFWRPRTLLSFQPTASKVPLVVSLSDAVTTPSWAASPPSPPTLTPVTRPSPRKLSISSTSLPVLPSSSVSLSSSWPSFSATTGSKLSSSLSVGCKGFYNLLTLFRYHCRQRPRRSFGHCHCLLDPYRQAYGQEELFG